MTTQNKKPYTPEPRMNVLKDQLKEQRFALINKVKVLREQRNALKGVKGTGDQWKELSVQIDQIQAKIDLLSKSLGKPVKDKTVLNSLLTPEMMNNLKPVDGHPTRLYMSGKTATEIANNYRLDPKVSVPMESVKPVNVITAIGNPMEDPVKVQNHSQSGRKHAMAGNAKPMTGRPVRVCTQDKVATEVVFDTSNPDLGRAVIDARDGKTKTLTIVTDEFGNLPDVAVGSYLTPTKPAPMVKDDLNHRQDNTSQMVMDDEDRDAWDRLDESVNGNK